MSTITSPLFDLKSDVRELFEVSNLASKAMVIQINGDPSLPTDNSPFFSYPIFNNGIIEFLINIWFRGSEVKPHPHVITPYLMVLAGECEHEIYTEHPNGNIELEDKTHFGRGDVVSFAGDLLHTVKATSEILITAHIYACPFCYQTTPEGNPNTNIYNFLSSGFQFPTFN